MAQNSLLDLQEMKPTPRNQLIGLLADALTAGRDFADKAKVPAVVPLLGGQGLGSLLLGKAPEELTNISYGNMPLRINPLAGRTASFVPEIKPGRKEQVADLAMALQAVPGGNRAALSALGAVDTGANKAAIVWHGSPHKFDRFDASKIGTGEGAQAYGHGLYFAESPSVAKQYQEALSNGKFVMRDGGSYNPDNPLHFAAAELLDGTASGKKPLDVASAIRAREKSLRERKTEWASMEADKLRKAWTAIAMKPDTLPRIDLVNDGALYKVDLPDEKIARMLDWDKPLSQQAPEVQAALQAADRRAKDSLYGSGGEYYRALMSRHAQNMPPHMSADAAENMAQAPASAQLRALGIPGIRYLDQGSRSNFRVQNTYKGQPYGEPVSFMTEAQARDYAAEQAAKGFGTNILPGTSNFVVFPGEEQFLRILERNGGLLGP